MMRALRKAVGVTFDGQSKTLCFPHLKCVHVYKIQKTANLTWTNYKGSFPYPIKGKIRNVPQDSQNSSSTVLDLKMSIQNSKHRRQSTGQWNGEMTLVLPTPSVSKVASSIIPFVLIAQVPASCHFGEMANTVIVCPACVLSSAS